LVVINIHQTNNFGFYIQELAKEKSRSIYEIKIPTNKPNIWSSFIQFERKRVKKGESDD